MRTQFNFKEVIPDVLLNIVIVIIIHLGTIFSFSLPEVTYKLQKTDIACHLFATLL